MGDTQTKVVAMSQSIRTLGALAVGALIVAVAALSVRGGPVSGAPTSTDPATHSITVTATGKTTVVPDVARVYLGVTANRSTVKAAREAGAKTMTDIIAAVRALGVDEKDIQTTNLSLNPQYGNGATPKVVGYQISEQVEITVRDLDKAGDVVDAATAKGATDVNGISFEVADPVKAQNDARAAAVAAARASAQAMAGAGSVSLGTVISMTDATPPSPIVYGYGAFKAVAPAADAATPVQPGTQDLTATVTVVFEID
ncbi:MAG TPA: SIMPL domain-containing protein [Candidatus Limnocylindrales bacterium]|nr:SIMPL domain-containing protein [Candidatus Limnocylindrales bacterium]